MTRLPRLARPNTASVRFRATALTTGAVAVLVLISAVAVDGLVAREVRSAADRVLTEQARDRAQLLDRGAGPDSLVTVIGHEVVAAVVTADGTVLAVSGTPEPGPLTALPEGVASVELTVTEEQEAGDGPAERPHAETLRVATVAAGNGWRVIVGNEGEEAARTLGRVRAVLAIGAPAIALLAGLILWLLTGRALRPVYRMRDELDAVVDAGLGGRVTEPGTRDEIDDLAATLNGVLARLDQQSLARRRFVADASHELKSPVANARALLETGGEPAQILGELDRLRALVDDLLFLARTDETVPTTPAAFDLDDLVFDEAERAALQAEVRLDASAVRPARALADRNEVARAVRNLLENAIRHGRARVTVAIEPGPSEDWVVAVSDDGPGISPIDRERVFDRFARLDDERSRGDGGTGLGLSIVQTIATRNGGRVAVVDPRGPGARLELSVPRAVDEPPDPTP